jgi:hypothetical protein
MASRVDVTDVVRSLISDRVGKVTDRLSIQFIVTFDDDSVEFHFDRDRSDTWERGT